ncbi:MAG: RNA-binding S4 domain-containing protein [Solobacterium sp.]|nr:RNA-binding S4 domain-containing protein [Solobacterium sp.]
MAKITTDYITLQQFLKLEDIASSGGEAKVLVSQLDITVNGEKENRRGRKLYPGDEIMISGKKYMVEK